MGAITVIGMGFSADDLTMGAVSALRAAGRVILHTGRCALAAWLDAQSIPCETLDALYERSEDFDEHARLAAEAVLDAASSADVVYAVFDVRDASVRELLSRAEKPPKVIAGPPSEGPLLAWSCGDAEMLEASDWENFRLSPWRDAVVREIDTRQLASEVKLKLLDCYPDESPAYALLDGAVAKIRLVELDRLKRYDHTVSVLVPAQRDLKSLERYDFDALVRIMAILRAPDGCPWDRAQTHESLRGDLLEEAWEAASAIDKGDTFALCDELGDVLMAVCLQAEIARQHGEFDIGDVTTAICEKMISRHSHIFGTDSAANVEETMELWQERKRRERGDRSRADALRSVDAGMPALTRAQKLLSRAEDAGLRLPARVAEAAEAFLREPGEHTLAELLLETAAAAREHGLDAELALGLLCGRFVERFDAMEKSILADGGSMETASPEEKKSRWDAAKA